MNKQIYLIGAGPGDLELLTLKAINILKLADVVLYDALVNEEIFSFCKKDVKKVYVGKRKDKHYKKQEEINELLVKEAKKHEITVRLKGGTPFVFGRGYEEVRAIKEAGFNVEIIPGVSSTTSVPETFMLPLVDRVFNDSYRTITGHDIKIFDEIVGNYNEREVLIIMMGIHNLKNIVNSLFKKNYPKDIKLALLSKGTTKEEKKVVFTLEELLQKEDLFFDEVKNLTPAMIFVGKVIDTMEELGF